MISFAKVTNKGFLRCCAISSSGAENRNRKGAIMAEKAWSVGDGSRDGTASDAPDNRNRKRSDMARLLDFAGGRKWLTYAGLALSAASQLLGFVPYVCIWLVARDLIEVAPNWQAATDISTYGRWAVGFAVASIAVYFLALMCTHLAAFRAASNMRKQTTAHLMKLPLGYFAAHATGELRRVVDGCAASTETLLATCCPTLPGRWPWWSSCWACCSCSTGAWAWRAWLRLWCRSGA